MWHTWKRRENCARFRWEIPNEIDLLEDQGVDGRTGSEWILGRLAGRMLSGLNWLRIGASGDFCEYGDEPLGSGATDLVSLVNIITPWPSALMYYPLDW
jgi:hypothetical protein